MLYRPIHRAVFKYTVLVLVAVSSLMAIDLYVPSLPAVAKGFKVSTGLAQLTIPAFLVSFALFQLFYGPLSDKFGRRPALIVGFSLYLLGSLLCMVALNIDVLLFGRFLQGAGAAAGAGLARVLVRDMFHGTRFLQMISYTGTIISLTPALAPILGGILQEKFGFRSNFFFLFAFALLVLGLLIRHFPETNLNKNPIATQKKHLLENIHLLFTSKNFIGSLLLSGLSRSLVIVYATVNPFLLQTILGVKPFMFGVWIFFIASGLVVSIFINSQLLKWIHIQILQLSGIVIVILTGITTLIFVATGFLSVSVVVMTSFLTVFGTGFILPNASATALRPFSHTAGLASSIYGATQMLQLTATSYILASFHAQTLFSLGLSFLLLGVFSLIVYMIFFWKAKPDVTE